MELGKSEVIIQDIVGCGKFQVIMTLCVFFLANCSPVFTTMFMSFGNFNPGWKCLQSNETNIISSTSNTSVSSKLSTIFERPPPIDRANDSNLMIKPNITSESCHVFESCEHIEFNSDSSTIVSEWGLICNRKWIPSLIISIQMAGVLVGGFIAGYIGDTFGRKVTIYTALFITTCLNLLSIFSTSWQMFAALRFFLGASSACVILLYYMFTAEFAKKKWRSVLQGIPAWNLSTVLFAITCMYFKDWRNVHLVTVAIGTVGLIPCLWVPESLRWLEVKNKTKQFERTARKVARVNGKTLPSMADVGKMVKEEYGIRKSATNNITLHPFRKGYRLNTFLLTVPWVVASLVYYALGFGVKAMHGNYYLNLIIATSIDIPFAIIPIFAPNLLGRKLSAIIFAGSCGLCLLGASCMDRLASESVKAIGVVVFIFIGKVTTNSFWCVLSIMVVEIYPTVVRGIGTSWCLTVARIGGVIAPFLIPEDENSVFISYTTMGILMMMCCGFVLKLPETKGKPLLETFETEEEENRV